MSHSLASLNRNNRYEEAMVIGGKISPSGWCVGCILWWMREMCFLECELEFTTLDEEVDIEYSPSRSYSGSLLA